MDNATHIATVEALKAEISALLQRAVAAEKQVLQFKYELDQLKRLFYGVKSERFEGLGGPGQMPLFEGEAIIEEPVNVIAPPVTTTRRKKRKPVRQALPSHLKREEIIIEPDEDITSLRRIGSEVTETLDYRAATLVVIRRVRPKYVDPRDEDRGVIIAPLPARPVEKGMAEPSLLAHVVIEKYADHMPLYRQVQRIARTGVTLAESTMGDWISASADLITPLHRALSKELLESGYIQADETPIRVQDSTKKGKTHRGYYWVYMAPQNGLVVMDYQRGRSRAGPSAFLNGYKGALQSDGYQVYDAYDKHAEVTTYNCMAHARRYFFDARESSPELSAHALTEIGQLYEVERELREGDSSPDERRRIRQQRSVPILERFRKWLQANEGLPKSPWGQAVHYSLVRWEKLCRYTENGRIEIDTNLVENAIRPIAIGRKNYLFSGSHEAAQRAAVIYSLLATCKSHDVNPYEWLTDVLTRIPTHPAKRVRELLPHRWENSKM